MAFVYAYVDVLEVLAAAAAAAVVVMCTCLYLNSTAVALTSVWQRRKTQHHFVDGFVSNVCVF